MLYAGARGRARDIRACFTLGFVRLERHRAAASRQTYALPLGKYHGGDKSIATAIARWSINKPSRHSCLSWSAYPRLPITPRILYICLVCVRWLLPTPACRYKSPHLVSDLSVLPFDVPAASFPHKAATPRASVCLFYVRYYYYFPLVTTKPTHLSLFLLSPLLSVSPFRDGTGAPKDAIRSARAIPGTIYSCSASHVTGDFPYVGDKSTIPAR